MEFDVNLLSINDNKFIHKALVKESGPEFLPGDFARGSHPPLDIT